MKTVLLATAFLLVPVGMASAADVDSTSPVAATYNWSGAYVGAQAGYAWGDARVGQTFAPGSFEDYGWGYSPSGGFGGLYIGYAKQFDGGLVLGVEGDYSFANVKDTTAYQALGVDDPAFGGVLELKAVGSVRLRAGYAMDRWLPFLTGGLGVANYKHATVNLPSGDAYADVDDTIAGYTLGAGLEYAVTDNWLVRGEYRFADFGRHTSVRHSTFDGAPINNDAIELTTHDIRVGIAYKF
ncbi:outer membrane protein [Mesorhizobium humile]|uniref:Porin family protein n=1 Tax=Mesorhizobium humile TaxID=3072313 RepID=A0ABU4YES0_9HYPH|nr:MULTISPECIES: outer membrane protein [unclassified Mesorhizobium]MDX8460450.1 porin family protein [Mesorhizobium sp. VK2D]MDX8485461.1 porin family protein [Mesorhizobium sp. VK2B]